MIYKNVAVIGLGYVGLPLVEQLIKKKIDVVGFDINSKKIDKVNRLNKYKKARLTSNYRDLKDRNFFIICVPTPINKKKKTWFKSIKISI